MSNNFYEKFEKIKLFVRVDYIGDMVNNFICNEGEYRCLLKFFIF